MSNQLQRVFEYEGQRVRTVMIDGEPWFVARDVCKSMGINNVSMAVSRLNVADVSTADIRSGGQNRRMSTVNESGLYDLILDSRKAEAKAFRRWVTSEVLPSIRQHGLYATDDVVDRILADPDFGIRLLTNYRDERQRRIQAEQKNAVLMHVNKTYTTTEIAKEIGFRSAVALNKDLAERRVQFRQNSTWVLYSDFATRGYTHIKQEVLDNGKVVYYRRWTQSGRAFLLDLYQAAEREAIFA